METPTHEENTGLTHSQQVKNENYEIANQYSQIQINDDIQKMADTNDENIINKALDKLPKIIHKNDTKKPKLKQLQNNANVTKIKGKKSIIDKNKQNMNKLDKQLKQAKRNNSKEDGQSDNQQEIKLPEVHIINKCKECEKYKEMLKTLVQQVGGGGGANTAFHNFTIVQQALQLNVQITGINNNQQQQQSNMNKQLNHRVSDYRVQHMRLADIINQSKLVTQSRNLTIEDQLREIVEVSKLKSQQIMQLKDQNTKYQLQLKRNQNCKVGFNSNDSDQILKLQQQNKLAKQQLADHEALVDQMEVQVQEVLQINFQLQENISGYQKLNESLRTEQSQIKYNCDIQLQDKQLQTIEILKYFKTNGQELESLLASKTDAVKKSFQKIQALQEEIYIQMWTKKNKDKINQNDGEEY